MSKKYLGKVAAGGALASAALFVAAPGIASASATPSTWDHKEDHGYIKTYPKWVHPGDPVKIIEVCSQEQEHAKVWSKVTGKVWLEPWRPPMDGAAPDDAAPGDAAPDGMPGWAGEQDHSGKAEDHAKGDEKGKPEWYGHDGKDGKDGKKHYVYVGEGHVKEYAHPGWYKVKGDCGYGKIHVVPERPLDPRTGRSTVVTAA